MNVETRPSVFHWITASLAILAIAAVAWVPILLIMAQFFPPEQRLIASLVGTVPVVLALLPAVIRSQHAARWSVDLEGFVSPAVGRISFSEVASLHSGYPRAESIQMAAFQSVVAPGARAAIDETLVLRLSDGRLLPLNLLSPSIRNGRAAMSKIEEMLAGKKHSNAMFSQAEIAVLKSRPMNRIAHPKNI